MIFERVDLMHRANLWATFGLSAVLLTTNHASRGADKKVWIVLEFKTSDGQPAQMTFDNPKVPDTTLSECKSALPKIQDTLVGQARAREPALRDAVFESASCILSADGPIKP
jgi:hypothetical protein